MAEKNAKSVNTVAEKIQKTYNGVIERRIAQRRDRVDVINEEIEAMEKLLQ